MEQSNSIHTISETQQKIIENLEKKVQHINFIAESYHLENKKLIRTNQELKIKLDSNKKYNIFVTTTAVILGLILIF